MRYRTTTPKRNYKKSHSKERMTYRNVKRTNNRIVKSVLLSVFLFAIICYFIIMFKASNDKVSFQQEIHNIQIDFISKKPLYHMK